MANENRKDRRPIDDRTESEALSGRDARFLERLNAAYAPRPMNATRRAALDERVREQIERRPWHSQLAPALAAAAVLAFALFWGLRSGVEEQRAPVIQLASVEGPQTVDWEAELYLYDGPVGTTAAGTVDEEFLPAEYAAIDRLFFDG